MGGKGKRKEKRGQGRKKGKSKMKRRVKKEKKITPPKEQKFWLRPLSKQNTPSVTAMK